jgi:hypothetical protein
VSTASSSFDTFITVYTGSSFATMSPLVCSDDFNGTEQSEVTFTAEAGTAYQIQVAGFNPSSTGVAPSGAALTAFTDASIPPGHDNFPAAAVAVMSSSDTDLTSNAGTETGEPLPPSLDCGIGSTGVSGKTVWYTFTRPEAAPVLITTAASYDPVVSVFQMVGGALSRLACNNDASGSTRQSRLAFTPQVGTQYFIQVAGRGTSAADGGNLSITFDFAPPANDGFAQAIAIAPALPSTASVDTSAATTQSGETILTSANCDGVGGGPGAF